MIQIDAIHFEEFRGIRQLDLRLDCKSFVVFGPNGSGKSGVVDAIDFALTGTVARLSGPGTSGLSVLKHGPHVHQRDNAGAAKVSLTIRDTVSDQCGVLTRTVKTATKYTLEPDAPELRAAVEQARQHPELTLSRREIIKYVVTEPGKRAQEVQALLKLDRIDETRRLLRTVQSKTATEAGRAESEVTAAEDAMRRHLDLTTLLTTEVTAGINQRREVLGLDPFEAVTIDTALDADAAGDNSESAFNKSSAIADVHTLIDGLIDHEPLSTAVDLLTAALDELIADPTILSALQHRSLVEAGLALVSEPACPLCDLAWDDIEGLRTHLDDKLARSAAAAALKERIQTAARVVVQQVRAVRELARTARPHAQAFGPEELPHQLQVWSDDLVAFETELASVDGATGQHHRLTTDPLALPANVLAELGALVTALEARPDQTATVSARSFLTVAQERWTRVRLARGTHAKAAAANTTANEVYEAYNSVADTALTTLYKTVEDDFSAYYRQINADDESSFKAELEPTAGKLDLEVDFYSLGMFPPAAYHSEGHQDGMGVCLYLALVKQLLGQEFRFAVLDDVVMSVDRNHRRQFCNLLKDVFPEVQFIITTHDEVWARQMQSAGLIGKHAQARFHGWTVDGGPIYEQGNDYWDQIAADLTNDDVPAAAHKLRRNLEVTMAELAASIRGQVAFRPDNNYELGDFFGAVKGRHGEWLRKAAASANSWNNEVAKQQVETLKAERSKALLAQEGENWAINALVHHNEWAAMSKPDFVPVVEACRQFLDLFSCSNAECESWIYIVGQPGHEEALKCNCGSLNLNLRTK
jgi:ABC-type Mn2+/Zn2+ transport system ATPase subunit